MSGIHPIVLFIFIAIFLFLVVDLLISFLRLSQGQLSYEVVSLTLVDLPGKDSRYRILLKSTKGNMIDVDIDVVLYERLSLLSVHLSPINYQVIRTDKQFPFKELSYKEVSSLEIRYLEGYHPIDRTV